MSLVILESINYIYNNWYRPSNLINTGEMEYMEIEG